MRKDRRHISLEPMVCEMLDAIADKMGTDPLYPRPSRSDLLNKAALLFIGRCKERPELKEVIESIEVKYLAAKKIVTLASTKKAARSRVRLQRLS